MDRCLQTDPKLPVWIIEHVWVHKMMDLQQAVDPSLWPDVDSQPLSLEDSWRLRVASAQVYSIVRRRDVELFEKAVVFLEATYRLLPGLVSAIKHMKIVFGLKTLVVMWMLRERRGMIDTVTKIIQFFPNKLPQYQDQCSQREMFLMRKNHLEFKSLAQTLAVDKERREDYIKNQVEVEYGEHYAQKVEDRLLDYLRELEALIPGETYIDKILKKQNPVTEEEKLLLEVITSDSMTIATTLKTLLNCDVASCRAASSSRSPGPGVKTVEASQPAPHVGSSKARELQPEVFKPGGVSSPQFCSKHQRWVKTILCECPDECSEELLLQANVSVSPPLFPSSSSSTSSSQDLTPSDLVPCPPRQPPPQTSNPEDELGSGSGSDPSQTEPPLQPSSSTKTLLPPLMSPVVRLVDIATSKMNYGSFNLHQTSQTSTSRIEVVASASSRHGRTSGKKDSSRLSRKFRQVCTRHSLDSRNHLSEQCVSAFRKSSSLSSNDLNISEPPTHDASTSTSTSQSVSLSDDRNPSSAQSCQRNVLRNQLRLSLQSQGVLLQSKLLQPCVILTKMDSEECHRATGGRSSAWCEEEDVESLLDLNTLYSSDSFSSEDMDHDPDYKPCISKKRLLLEYENARILKPL
ncbi:uncharacterized protein LOC125015065 isoform X2 [Mugil cephalus]|nr:uncharacterized protein LOC125015065 isoform X2 [Mugil cephalus]